MISIIGAGPVGNYTAYLLSEKYDVNVFEQKNKIGLPVQCAGIVTSSFKKIIKLKKDIIKNEISKARIFSPNNNFIEVNLKEKDLVIDRCKFDNHLADLAKQRGAKYHMNSRYIGNKKDILLVEQSRQTKKIQTKEPTQTKEIKEIKKIKFKYLIGADGPLSRVAKSNNLFKKNQRHFWNGIQARVKIKNDNAVEFYPYFGTYAWLIPEDEETARIGLVSKRYTKILFRNFLFKFKQIKNKDIIEYQAGVIPKYNPNISTQKTSSKSAIKSTIYIVGDSASQVKATTGGGIVQGLSAAKALADTIIHNEYNETKTKQPQKQNNLRNNHIYQNNYICKNNYKYDYQNAWKKSIGKELYLHLKARNMMDKFQNKDWNRLVDIMNSKECKEVLANNNRDNLSTTLFRLILKKPSLLSFARRLLY